jgi:hypothetical protein
MQEVHTAAVVSGRTFTFRRSALEKLARSLEPEPIRAHFVVIGGLRYPPKQIVAAATGIDRNDFTTNQARAILRRLGFTVGRAGGGQTRRAAEATVPYRSAEADALRPYIGRWVAVRDSEVLYAADSPEEVYEWLVRHDQRAGALFRVPVDPEVDIGGFAL